MPHEYAPDTSPDGGLEPERSPLLSKDNQTALRRQIDTVFGVWDNYGTLLQMDDVRGLYIARSLLDEMDEQQEENSGHTVDRRRTDEDMVRQIDEALSRVRHSLLDTATDSDSYRLFVNEAKSLDSADVTARLPLEYEDSDVPILFEEDEIRLHLRANIPPIAIASLASLSVVDTLDKQSDDGQSGHTRGAYSVSAIDGKPRIRLSNRELTRFYETRTERLIASGIDRELARSMARNMTLSGITHEFGHALHTLLPVAALKRWDEVIQDEPIFITDYARQYFEHGHPSRYAEDFAESMALFVHDPARLKSLSSARFEGMDEVFQDVMPGYGPAEDTRVS